jgi:hypothetical protein
VTAIVVRTGHCGHTESLKRPSSSNPSHARNGTRRSARPHVLLLLLLFLFFPYFAFSGSSPPVFDNKTPFKPRHKTKMTYVSESQSFPPSPPPPPPLFIFPFSYSLYLALSDNANRHKPLPRDSRTLFPYVLTPSLFIPHHQHLQGCRYYTKHRTSPPARRGGHRSHSRSFPVCLFHFYSLARLPSPLAIACGTAVRAISADRSYLSSSVASSPLSLSRLFSCSWTTPSPS